ncbi:MAG: hypothetical protein L0H93_07035 [Nocardioides sp.]|nr:hypothetical protein [Nocardioides sp.]
MAHLPRRLSAFATAATLMVTLGACSSDDTDDSSDPGEESSVAESSETPTASASVSESPSASASESPSATKPATPTAPKSSATPSRTPSNDKEPNPTGLPTPGTGKPNPTLVAKLLSPGELPGLNDATAWSQKQTGSEGSKLFGYCQKSAITDIGATDVVVRTYDAHGSQAGAQLVATFADAKSARRANDVLKSWQASCKKRLDAQVKRVNPIVDVPSSKGAAQSYLVQFGKRNAEFHTFHGVGITRVGSVISIVTVDVMSQDYNYEVGQEPASRAAAAAAGKL